MTIPQMPVRVRVVVTEDDVEVAATEVSYYPTQPYAVELTTPDGVDASIKRNAGEDS